MIKIKVVDAEYTIEGTRWSGEDSDIVDVLNRLSGRRPFQYERRPEAAIAHYIVSLFKERGEEAEIIYDSKAGQPAPVYAPNEKI